MKDCIFCMLEKDKEQKVILSNEYCMFLRGIIPKEHRETVFDLTEEEWTATFELLREVKRLLDKKYSPQGYNVGWNVGKAGGQEIFHLLQMG